MVIAQLVSNDLQHIFYIIRSKWYWSVRSCLDRILSSLWNLLSVRFRSFQLQTSKRLVKVWIKMQLQSKAQFYSQHQKWFFKVSIGNCSAKILAKCRKRRPVEKFVELKLYIHCFPGTVSSFIDTIPLRPGMAHLAVAIKLSTYNID